MVAGDGRRKFGFGDVECGGKWVENCSGSVGGNCSECLVVWWLASGDLRWYGSGEWLELRWPASAGAGLENGQWDCDVGGPALAENIAEFVVGKRAVAGLVVAVNAVGFVAAVTVVVGCLVANTVGFVVADSTVADFLVVNTVGSVVDKKSVVGFLVAEIAVGFAADFVVTLHAVGLAVADSIVADFALVEHNVPHSAAAEFVDSQSVLTGFASGNL